MSQYVRERGKLTPTKRVGEETLEEQCKRILGVDDMSYYDSYAECIVSDGMLYSMDIEYCDCEYQFCELVKNEDCTLDFHTMYYNGGLV